MLCSKPHRTCGRMGSQRHHSEGGRAGTVRAVAVRGVAEGRWSTIRYARSALRPRVRCTSFGTPPLFGHVCCTAVCVSPSPVILFSVSISFSICSPFPFPFTPFRRMYSVASLQTSRACAFFLPLSFSAAVPFYQFHTVLCVHSSSLCKKDKNKTFLFVSQTFTWKRPQSGAIVR